MKRDAPIYVRWQPDELAIGILGERARVQEPPHVVVNDKGQIYAIGLEGAEAAARSGFPLIQLSSFRDVQRHPDAAAKLLYYLVILVWLDGRSNWRLFTAALFPPLRPSVVLHFASDAEDGVSAEAAAPLIEQLQACGVRRVFLWVGDELGAYAGRGAPVRGDWIGEVTP